MRELEAWEWRCARCGADLMSGGTGEVAGGRRPTFGERVGARLFTAEARPRSGLASAAGFAGLAYLFWPSVDALAVQWLGAAGSGFAFLWGAAAPLAMLLGLAAARDIDRAPWKVGRAQAMLGYLIGLPGTLHLAFEFLR